MKNRATAQIKCELENYGVYTDCPKSRCVYEEIHKAFICPSQEKNPIVPQNYGIYRVAHEIRNLNIQTQVVPNFSQ